MYVVPSTPLRASSPRWSFTTVSSESCRVLTCSFGGGLTGGERILSIQVVACRATCFASIHQRVVKKATGDGACVCFALIFLASGKRVIYLFHATLMRNKSRPVCVCQPALLRGTAVPNLHYSGHLHYSTCTIYGPVQKLTSSRRRLRRSFGRTARARWMFSPLSASKRPATGECVLFEKQENDYISPVKSFAVLWVSNTRPPATSLFRSVCCCFFCLAAVVSHLPTGVFSSRAICSLPLSTKSTWVGWSRSAHTCPLLMGECFFLFLPVRS